MVSCSWMEAKKQRLHINTERQKLSERVDIYPWDIIPFQLFLLEQVVKKWNRSVNMDTS